ncbi:ABC transporter permease [Erysipelothrix urinaevulpis]|uniref:ABC transporter permease n=1 Tax=Erysipelothrix urinaevulpis TaxID=2683717 RepID=UPI001359A696|nr:ABC transporter permease [Erysipelothrix urinaevulpis]
MNLRKWKALIKKDFKLTLNNKSIFFVFIMPVLFAVIYKYLLVEGSNDPHVKEMVLSLVTMLGFGVIGASSMAITIAEEKEKKTLRSLMLSDVSGLEFVISKLVVMVILFMISMIACYVILGAAISGLPLYLLNVLMTTLALLLFSSVIGILSPTQQTAGLLGMPVMFLSMLPIFAMMSGEEFMITIMKFIPTGPIMFFMNPGLLEQFDYSLFIGYLTITLWIVIGLAVFGYFYHKKGFDN